MDPAVISLILLAAVVITLLLGLPVGFTLGGMALLGCLYVWGPKGLYLFFNTAYAEGTSFLLLAIPLFILMANILRFSDLADDLYEMVYRWMGRVPGGLAAGTVVICALFAAMSGISSVATVSMGLIALPSMLKRGYKKNIATGCISAGGSLGILIPPSVLFVVYGSMAEVSIGKLFIGGLLPGILLAVLFCIYILVLCVMRPNIGPPVDERFSFREKIASLKGVILPSLLIVLVLGVIYTGVATPTEASGIGALGAIVCVLIQGKFSFPQFRQALISTLGLNAMVMWIIIGAVSFTHILAYTGITGFINDLVLSFQVSKWVILFIIQFVFFILGMFLDPAGIIMLTTPIFVPIVKNLGFDPVWFGVLFMMNMEMAYITPPFGFNLFIMKAVVPKEITMSDIYRSILPFVALEAAALLIVIVLPEIALWLPSKMIFK